MNNPFQKYPHYKPSGVQWLGDIPEHWEVKRFRNVFNLGKGLTITKENLKDEGILCVNYGEIHSKYAFVLKPEVHKLKCVDTDYLKKSSNSLLNNGDFVFADTSEDIEGSGNFTHLESSESVFAGYHTIIARPIPNLLSKFLAYEFDSLSFRSQIKSKVKGVKVYSITQSILNELVIWLPPLPEQTAIAQFLDRKTAQIEVAIAQKQRMIELLKERRQILIHQAVTRGLNPDVPMKDSGVDGGDLRWIGKIPAHWAISKLGFYTTSIQTGPFGSQLHSHDYIENGVPVINPSHIIGGEIIPDNTQTINPLKHQELKHHTLNVGDIIFGRRGEMGRCAMVRPDDKVMICGTGSIKLSLDKSRIYPEYLNHYLKIGVVKDWFSLNSVGSTMENLNSSILSTVPILIPSITEQIIISKHIETATQKIDKAIGLKEQEIEKLKEYKASLINSVVTGKVKVTENPEGVS